MKIFSFYGFKKICGYVLVVFAIIFIAMQSGVFSFFYQPTNAEAKQAILLANLYLDDDDDNGRYEIWTVSDYKRLATYTNSGGETAGMSFELKTTLDFENNGVVPIGNYTYRFKGRFYGNGHQIKNFAISDSYSGDKGFFGYIAGSAIVSNLHITSGTISCSPGNSAGAVSGSMFEQASITACTNMNCIITATCAGSCNIGGIVGYLDFESNSGARRSAVSGCANYAKLTGSTTGGNNFVRVGGIAGYANWAIIEKCQNTAELNADTALYPYAGGILGYGIDACVTNSLNTGLISAYGASSSTSDTTITGPRNRDEMISIDSGTTIYLSKSGGKTTTSRYGYAGGIVGMLTGSNSKKGSFTRTGYLNSNLSINKVSANRKSWDVYDIAIFEIRKSGKSYADAWQRDYYISANWGCGIGIIDANVSTSNCYSTLHDKSIMSFSEQIDYSWRDWYIFNGDKASGTPAHDIDLCYHYYATEQLGSHENATNWNAAQDFSNYGKNFDYKSVMIGDFYYAKSRFSGRSGETFNFAYLTASHTVNQNSISLSSHVGISLYYWIDKFIVPDKWDTYVFGDVIRSEETYEGRSNSDPTIYNGGAVSTNSLPSGFNSSYWGVNSSINSGYPYLKTFYWEDNTQQPQ